MVSLSARVLGLVSVSSLVAIVACGSTDNSTFDDGSGGANGGDNGNGNLFGATVGPSGHGEGPCVGLQCQQVACEGGVTTSLVGQVTDPSGTVPLYNAIVYVPNAELTPFPDTITCDKCGTAPSGSPITTEITKADGTFTLKNVPVGVDVPVVVQIGRWRRKVIVPAAHVGQCQTKALEADLTRLPRTRAEGDIPKIAITTGSADSLECFVRKMGVDPAEFTNLDKGGRFNLFVGKRTATKKKKGGGTTQVNADGARIDAATPDANTLWDDPAALKKFDMVILSCEGDENNSTKSEAARANLEGYLAEGGRVFASHFHYTWIKNGSGQLPDTATWVDNGDIGDKNVTVDTTFDKGKAFAEWLDDVGATTAKGSNTVAMTELRRNVASVPGTGLAATASRRWLYTGPEATGEPKFYSFNAPIGQPADQQCGRAVYTDIHVSSGDKSDNTHDFPTGCTTQGYTPQEKALLFLLMDLSSCIQDDSKPPTAPPVSVK